MLVLLALAECGGAGPFLRTKWFRIATPILLVAIFAGADRADLQSRRLIHVLFAIRPEALDGLALNGIPVALPSIVFHPQSQLGRAASTAFRCGLVYVYWFVLVSVAQGQWPAGTRVYSAIRGWLAAAFLVVFGLSLLGWLLASGDHGPTGAFGSMAGTGLAAIALRTPGGLSHKGTPKF